MTASPAIGQRGRLAILVLYLVGLAAASWAAHGTWMPPASERGIWFYSALAALLLGNLLVTPFFTSPANAISYAVAALVTLFTVNPWTRQGSGEFDRFTWSVASLYVVSVLAAALVAIAGKDATRPTAHRIARSAHAYADIAGSPRAVFSSVFLFALITYHRAVPREYLVIGLSWALFVGLRPLETLAGLWARWRSLWTARGDLLRLGEVVGHEAPGLVLIRVDEPARPEFGDLLLARTEGGGPGIAIALDHVGFAGGRWLRAIHMAEDLGLGSDLWAGEVGRVVSGGSVLRVADRSAVPGTSALAERARDQLIGLVAPDTTVGELQIELVRSDTDIHEGSLLEVQIGKQVVLYQVVRGITKEELLIERNKRGFVRAQARKIGAWNSKKRAFDPVPWLPQPNQPVLLVAPQQTQPGREAIGHFPGTSYPVGIDPHRLVTHNAAILGILGVGKSFLALELVERMIDAGIRVVCLDLTDQYSSELGKFLDADLEEQAREELAQLGPPGKTNVKRNVEEGGSIGTFTAKLREQLAAFLDPAGDSMLRILKPSRFEVWRQDSKAFGDQASMATLSPAEITRLITESVLDVLQNQGLSEDARCCIVYEEAHSLIPEWNAVASEGDKTATNGTAKAILQGRKFGLGCLVITQRTANVTKSILNQCNTVFGLRVFDATGMDFLGNYLGQDYAGVLSTLEDRHAVVFGRASSCREPVLVRLNDREDFLRVFRHPDPPATGPGEQP